ncbi:Mannose-P-dolichol utilization defect 1 protein homolog 1 [Galdieria sulphuraria]|nr:Mannose-P-dolichol utilization defect 1 protein homolog 1 [Galdieria sulphuraria]
MNKGLSFGVISLSKSFLKHHCLKYSTPATYKCINKVKKQSTCQQSSISLPSPDVVRCNHLKSTSSLIGYVVIFCSTFYKVPQIARIITKKSSKGISLSMYVLESIGIYFSLCYCIQAKFPWETFAESICIFVQNIIITLFLYKYTERKDGRNRNLVYALIPLMGASLLCIRLPIHCLQLLQVCSSPLMNISKIPQILRNERNQSTGELSPITLSFQLAGNVARVFTTIVQLRNRWFLTSISISLILNAILGLQYIRYRFSITKSTYFPDDHFGNS